MKNTRFRTTAKNLKEWGPISITEGPNGICKIDFGTQGLKPQLTSSKVWQTVECYLSGKAKKISLPYDLQTGTEFQQKVWKALQGIPYGQTKSYKWVAEKIGKPKAVRAVGRACGANPLPLLIPCHRVVASNGKIGGFSGGLEWKRRLLRLEGIQIK